MMLYYELTGMARLWHRVWYDAERGAPMASRDRAPLGPIETRVTRACVATYVWHHFYLGINNSHDRVVLTRTEFPFF